ncbi:hypothetical protein LTR50_000995 [Elasticomyces elasticus]|nr:hypothetical protein LTR50_000995 [Elasticomyces elasticus]
MATSTRARSPSPPARDLIELAEKATKSYFDNGRHNAGYEGYRQRAKDVTDPLADKTAADKRLKRSTSFRKAGAAARRSLGSIGVGLQKLGTKLEGWSSRPGSPAPTTPTSYAESLRSEEGHPKRYSKTMQDAVTKAKEEQERMDVRISAGYDYFDNHQLVDAPPQVVYVVDRSLTSENSTFSSSQRSQLSSPWIGPRMCNKCHDEEMDGDDVDSTGICQACSLRELLLGV